MCALTQRFGRGARDPELSAVAVLFAESKHFDDRGTSSRKRKRSELESVGPDTEIATEVAQVPPSVCDDERRRTYQSWKDEGGQRDRKGRRGVTEIEPVLGDMVNAARRGINCLGKPSQLFFDNDRISKLLNFLTVSSDHIDSAFTHRVRPSRLSTIARRLLSLRSSTSIKYLLQVVQSRSLCWLNSAVNSQIESTSEPVNTLEDGRDQHGSVAQTARLAGSRGDCKLR